MRIQSNRTERGRGIVQDLAARRAPRWHPDTKELDDAISMAIASGNFHDAFVPLKIKRDHYRGIHSTYETDSSDNPVLVRDARPQQYQKYQCEASYYKYVQLGLNYLNGILDLLDIENDRRETEGQTEFIDVEAAKGDLVKLASEFYKDIIPDDPDDPAQQAEAEFRADYKYGRFFYDIIVPFYRQYRPDLSDTALREELKLGRNFANMKAKPYAIATTTRHAVEKEYRRGGKETIDTLELELPMVELTDTQRRLYLNRHREPWYTGQSDLARALIDRYADDVLQGAMIPAQLIYHLIGTRNGYEKWTVVMDHYDEASAHHRPHIINIAHHAGSQAHMFTKNKLPNIPDKEQRKRIRTAAVQSTIDQLYELTDANHLTINTLVSPLGINKDAEVERQIRKTAALDETLRNIDDEYVFIDVDSGIAREREQKPKPLSDTRHTRFANMPQNFGRRLGMRNISGIEELLNIARDFLLAPQGKSGNYLEQMQRYLEKRRANNITEPPDIRILQLYNAYFHLQIKLNHNSAVSDPDNNNLEITACANILVDTLNLFSDETTISYVLISGCFSGQDRGGMVSTHTTNLATINYLKFNNPLNDKPEKERNAVEERQSNTIYLTQAYGRHTQEMAGNAGTGFGGEGVKEGSIGVIPSYYPQKAKVQLTSKTGIYNEHSPRNPSRPFYKKKSFWIGGLLILAGIGLCATGALAFKGLILLGIGSVITAKVIAGSMIVGGIATEGAAAGYYRYARGKRLSKFDYSKIQKRTIDRHSKNTIAPLTLRDPEPFRIERVAEKGKERVQREFPTPSHKVSVHALSATWQENPFLGHTTQLKKSIKTEDEKRSTTQTFKH